MSTRTYTMTRYVREESTFEVDTSRLTAAQLRALDLGDDADEDNAAGIDVLIDDQIVTRTDVDYGEADDPQPFYYCIGEEN